MKTGILLQVRLDSKRYNRKALLTLGEVTVIELTMMALKTVAVDVHALVTDKASFLELKPLAEKQGFKIFQGPKNDVLKRYILAAEYYNLNQIIRATGDNPFVSPNLCKEIIKIHTLKKADLSHFLGMPLGTGVEIIKTTALKSAHLKTNNAFEREHITTYLYRHRDVFTVIEEKCASEYYLPDYKISLDNEADYLLIKQAFNDLYQDCPIEIDELVKWIKRHEKTSTKDKRNENLYLPQQSSR